MTYDNFEEIGKIRKHAPHAGLALRLKVPNTGAMVELSSKFGAASGEAVDLIEAAHEAGLVVEGLSFHVGSQTTNFENYVQALNLAAGVFREAADRGFTDEAAGHRRRLSRPLRLAASSPSRRWPRRINAEFDRLFPKNIEILAEPGRFLVATAGTAGGQGDRQGRPRRQTLLLPRRRRVPHLLRHHLRPLPVPPQGVQEGPDADLLGLRPDLRRPGHDLAGRGTARARTWATYVYSENIGAYSHASSTWFNGFPPAKVVHINQGIGDRG